MQECKLIGLARYRGKWQAVLKAIMKLRAGRVAEDIWTNLDTISLSTMTLLLSWLINQL
jgi:hypothetical protein